MTHLKMQRGADNEILRAVSAPVPTNAQGVLKPDRKLAKFVEEMRETMFTEKGIGLAARQVGVNTRVVVCRFNHETPHEVIVAMINPVITHKSKEMVLSEEGCLSLPKQFDAIARHASLTVKYLDVKGRENVLKLEGLNARIVQHEVDHIDGHLYIDHLTDEATLRLKRAAG